MNKLYRKIIHGFLILLTVASASGCATYEFNSGKKPYGKGYTVSRDGYSIAEYTVGKDNSMPKDIALAKQRFKRRKGTVEYYYKKMGYIEARFKEQYLNHVGIFLGFLTSPLRLPFIAVSDYRYGHNPKYKERVDKIEDEKEARNQARINKLKNALNAYIQQDLSKEG